MFKDKRHMTEYLLTVEYVNRYLEKGMKILEIGAGTGAYSLSYAKQGYEIHALEYVKENLDFLKSKLESDMDIHPVLGDGRDLSMYEDDTFDFTLCLGPLYHLDVDGRKRCIDECTRVTKKGGLIYMAYISNNFTFVKCVKKFDKYLLNADKEIGEGFEINDSMNVFTFMHPEQMEVLIKENGLEKVHHLTTDGISSLVDDRVNSFSDEEFAIWIEYLKSTAEREDQLGYGEHLLYIARKN